VTNQPNPAMLVRLIRSIAILALPYDAQVQWLDSLGLGEARFADEMALELEDGVRLLPQFENAGWLKSDVVALIRNLDEFLGARSGPERAAFWDLDSLQTSADWSEVRRLATNLLLRL
jgi:hypothetical protein